MGHTGEAKRAPRRPPLIQPFSPAPTSISHHRAHRLELEFILRLLRRTSGANETLRGFFSNRDNMNNGASRVYKLLWGAKFRHRRRRHHVLLLVGSEMSIG